MALKFEFLEGLRFTCTLCADCCRLDVPLFPGEEDRLARLDWGEDVPSREEVGRTLEGGQRALNRTAKGVCIYLADDGRCRIHTRFGESAKPRACRSFPFTFHRLGARIAVDTSFYCKSIAERSGAPLSEHVEAWREQLGKGPDDPGGHSLNPDRAVDSELLWTLEEELVQLLAVEDSTPFERVRYVLAFVRLAATGDPSTSAAAKLRSALSVGLPTQIRGSACSAELDRTQRNVFRQWLFASLNPAPHAWSLLPSAARAREMKKLERAGTRFRKGRGHPWIDHRELQSDFDSIGAVGTRAFDAEAGELVVDYLTSRIKGQGFLQETSGEMPLVEAVQKQMLAFPMCLWTAKALAAERGAGELGEDDVRAAIRLVDRTAGRISTSMLPEKQARAFDWVMMETELVEAATVDLLTI